MYKNTLKFMMKRKHDEVNDNPSPKKKKNHEDNTIDKKNISTVCCCFSGCRSFQQKYK